LQLQINVLTFIRFLLRSLPHWFTQNLEVFAELLHELSPSI